MIRISPKRELSRFAAYNNLDDIDGDMDELTQYRRELPADAHVDPLAWWVTNHHRFPVLRHLAFTLLAAPASTAADERLFSMAGGVVNQHRPHTQQEPAESVNAYDHGIQKVLYEPKVRKAGSSLLESKSHVALYYR